MDDLKSNFNDVLQHLDTLETTQQKLQYLIEQKANRKLQLVNKRNPLNFGGGGGFDSFTECCEIEIKKIHDLMNLGMESTPVFKLSDKRGVRTNIIRILDALYEMNYVSMPNGQFPTKKDFFKAFGQFLDIDLSNYDTDLSQAYKNAELETNLAIFEEMKQKIQNIIINKLK